MAGKENTNFLPGNLMQGIKKKGPLPFYLFLLFAKSHNDSGSEDAAQVLFPSVGVLFLHTYTVVCCKCMFVIGQKLFEVVLVTVRTYFVKTDVCTATVCKHSNCSWFAELCEVDRQDSVC